MMVTKRKKRATQEGSSKAILAVAVIVAITTRIANNMMKATEGTDFKILHDSISLHSVYMVQKKIAYLKKYDPTVNEILMKLPSEISCASCKLLFSGRKGCKKLVKSSSRTKSVSEKTCWKNIVRFRC